MPSDQKNPKTFVGIQIGAISFVDEGVAPVLDYLQETAGVNALMISALSWSRGNAGRAMHSYPDHGGQEPDQLKGGAFFKTHPEYYNATSMKAFQAPDPLCQGFDTLGDVIPEARKRGMKVYPYYCETARSSIKPLWQPGFPHFLDVDHYGRKSTRASLMNPDYRAWMQSVVEDWFKNYELDGLLWGIELEGPLCSLLMNEVPTGFDRYHVAEARRRGIDVQRAVEGYQKVAEFLAEARAGKATRDGHFVTFLRLLLRNPEILMWEKLWLDAHRSFYQELSGLVKFFNPKYEMGLGIWQEINTFNPILRAQHDFSEYVHYADFLKPVLYDAPAGARFKRFADELQKTILRDAEPAEVVDGLATLLQLDEAGYDELPMAGFSAAYIKRETERLVEAVGGKVKVYPGIGAGVTDQPGTKPIRPEDMRAGVHAAYDGGASGVLISRNYSEARLENIQAIGQALKERGLI